MGLRETLKSLRGGDKGAADAEPADAEASEPTWFQPEYDGSYGGAAGPQAQVTLRFLPGGKVFESTDAAHPPGPEQQNPCRGEYTGAGRFNVQRQFERIISYAVLAMEPEGFFARRINAADRSMTEIHFVFAPDGGRPS